LTNLSHADPRDCPYVGLDPFEKAYEPFFFGREFDSRVIADHVISRPITILYGPSGVGKSSILNVGVPAALGRRRRWMVVTLRYWQDPSEIQHLAVKSLEAALPADIKNSRQWRAPFWIKVDAALKRTRQPLLFVLDQFEEYFLYRTEYSRAAIEKPMAELLARRGRDIRVLIGLRDDSLHLLNQLRAVFPGVLETTVPLGHLSDAAVERAIRGPIEKYNELYRQSPGGHEPVGLDDNFVRTVIDELRQGGHRPAGDAIGGSSEEPIELPYLQLTMTKVWDAEGGRSAKRLRTETLTRTLGGVEKIARQHVDKILNDLTSTEQALCADIFRYLVTGSGGKIAYPANDLARQIGDDRKQAGADGLVSADEVEGLLRKLTPTATRLLKPVRANGVDAFELFHDVLGPPVLRWRREFNANLRLASEKRRARRAQWLASVFGAVTFVALLATVYAYVQWIRAKETVGRSVWSSLEFENSSLGSADFDGLWTVMGLVGHERDGFLAPITGGYFDRGPVARFAEWTSAIVRPIGVSLLDKAQPASNLLERFGRRPRIVLRALGLQPLDEAQAKAAAATIVAAMKEPANPPLILAQALQALPGNLTDSQVQSAADAIIAAMKQTADSNEIQPLAQALEALPGNLTDSQAQGAADAVGGALKQTTFPPFLIPLSRALETVVGKMTKPQAQAAVDSVVAAIEQTADPDALGSQARPLRALAGKLSDSQAQVVADAIIAAIKQTVNPNALQSLAQALQALADKPIGPQVQSAADAVIAAMKQTANPNALQSLAQTLKALPSELTIPQAQAAADSVVVAMTQTNDPDALSSLGQAVVALAGKLTDSQAGAAADAAVAALKQTPNSSALRSLANALKALAGKLTDSQAQGAADAVVAAMKRAGGPVTLASLAEALHALAGRLTNPQARTAADVVIAAMKQSNFSDALESGSKALQALADKLTDSQTQAVADAVVAAMKQTDKPDTLPSLAQAVRGLAGKLTDWQAQGAADAIVAAMKQPANAFALQSLSQALQALAGKLTDSQAQGAADAVIAAMKQTYDYPALPQALQALAGKLTNPQAQAGADAVLAAMERAPANSLQPLSQGSLQPLSHALQTLSAKLTDTQAVDLAVVARRHLALAGAEENEKALAGAMAALAGREDDKAFLIDIVEALKYPTAGGEASDTLMAALRERFPDVPELKEGIDAAVPWFEKQLGADVVARSPQRP
jgi:hypothetical protein